MIEVNGQFQLLEHGHTIVAEEMVLAVGDDALHMEQVRDAEETDDVGVYKVQSRSPCRA